MAKNDELQKALDAVAKEAIRSDTKKSKEEYLEDFKNTRDAFSMKRKKFVRFKGGSDVFTEDVKTKLEQERQARTYVSQTKQRLTFIYKMKKHQRKTGNNMNVAAYEKAVVKMLKNDPKYGLCAVCDFGPPDDIAHILIPFDKFTNMTEEQLSNELRITPHTFLSRRLETTIDFCVEDYIPSTETSPEYFLGNRVDAMQDKCAHLWYSIEVDGSSRNYRFNEGSIIEARIVGVFPKAGVMVEVFGVESLIPQREIAWTRFRDLRELKDIKLGDTVMVKIMTLERSEEKVEVSFTASIKQTKPNPMEQALLIYSPGVEVSGTVTMINWNESNINSSNVIVRLPHEAEVFCQYPSEPVIPGQRVTVQIGKLRGRNKNGQPFMHARIIHVDKEYDGAQLF